MRFLIVIIILALAVIATARVAPRLSPAPPAPCRLETFEAARFTVCTLDTRKQELRLYDDGADAAPLRSFDALDIALGKDAKRLRFAMNAGMFDDTGTPVGLFVHDGKEQTPLNTRDGPGNFHMKPNGVFSVDAQGHARVETSEAFAKRAEKPRWATQSGPMLLIDRKLHPKIQADGPSRLIRNAVGAANAHTALFVISETPVSFGKLARFFRDKLGCANALYLDGVVSSLWAPGLKRRDADHELGPMVVVLART